MTTTKRRPFCHPSPNEETYLRQLKLEERRKARLLQVREQEKRLARQLREKVKTKRKTERKVLQEHVNTVLAEAHEVELRELEEKYLSRVNSVGQGHRDAQQVNEEENRLQELRLLLQAKQRWRAQDRHAAAMKELTDKQLKKKQSREQALHYRQQALQAEKRRANQLATTKSPTNKMIVMDFAVDRGRRVQFKEADSFSSSYYHIHNPVVQRLGTSDAAQPNAQKMAELQMEQDDKTKQSAAALQQEHDEKARLRYKHAMAKVKLEKERAQMLVELKSLEREDRSTRQKSLAKMPTNMFQPTHQRIEMASEQQREMEGAFERLFVRPQPQQGASVSHSLADHSTLSSLPDLSITDQSSTTHSEPLPEEDNYLRILTASPKATPDSGVHINSSVPSTEESVQPQSTQEYDGGMTDETENVTGRHDILHTRDSMTSSLSSSNDDSRPHQLSQSRQAWPASQGAGINSSEGVSTRGASTQTHRPKQYLVRPSFVLDRPELTVTDTTSSDDQSTGGGATGERRGPAKSRKGEGMKTLLSMIQAQHQSWNDRLKKREELIKPLSQSEDEGTVDSLSVYSLSTRESTASPSEQVQHPTQQSDLSTSSNQLSISQYQASLEASTLPMAPLSPPPHSHAKAPQSDLSTSSNQLSISQYQTSLEASTLPMAPLPPPPHSHAKAPQSDLSTSPNQLSISQYQASLEASTLPPHSHAIATQSDLSTSSNQLSISRYQTSLEASTLPMAPPSPPSHSHAKAPQPSHLHTKPLTIPHPLARHTQKYESTTNTQVEPTSPQPPPTANPFQEYAHTLIVNENIPETVLSSSAAHKPLLSVSVDSEDKFDSCLSSPHVQLPLSAPPTSATQSMNIHSTNTYEDSPNMLESSSLEFTPLPMDNRDATLPQHSDDNLELSILTLDSTQLSLTAPSPLVTHTTTHREPINTVYEPPTQTSPLMATSTQPEPHESAAKELSILDTIEETDTEMVNNSDSFRGDRMQDEPPLSITGLDSTDYSHLITPGLAETTQSPQHTSPVNEQSIQAPTTQSTCIVGKYDSPTTETMTAMLYSPTVRSGLGLQEAFMEKDDSSPTTETTTAVLYSPTVHSGLSLQEAFRRKFDTPTSETTNAVVNTPTVHSGLSLQEAFLRRKKEFVKKSQRRLKQIKATIEKQKAQQTSTLKPTSGHKHSTGDTYMSKESTSKSLFGSLQRQELESGVENRRRVVTFSSPLLQNPDSAGTFKPPVRHRGQPTDWMSSHDRERIKKTEMRERNKRFYYKLPEVRKRMEEETRKQVYSVNRDKARSYQEKIRSKMKSQRAVAGKTQPKVVTDTCSTKTKTKPPFK